MNRQGSVAFCHGCVKDVELLPLPNLQVKITSTSGISTAAKLVGAYVDKILKFDVPFVTLYRQSVLEARKKLVDCKISGTFIVNQNDHVVGCK